jgi:ADP-ribosylglycohydrolase
VFSCFIFSKVVQKIIEGEDKITSYKKAIKEINDFKEAPRVFNRILDGSLPNLKEETIGTSGYVLHTLEASLWCFLNTTTYETAVLTAVNLGEDTDTTACVTGALAGLYYGPGEIRDHWKTTIARGEDIRLLAGNFAASISTQ